MRSQGWEARAKFSPCEDRRGGGRGSRPSGGKDWREKMEEGGEQSKKEKKKKKQGAISVIL